jgi:hypothetical protein
MEDQSMTEVRAELPYMQLPERYVRVKLKGTKGPVCICEPGDVKDFCDGGEDEYEFEDVYMTQSEVEALPEFEGF